MDMEAKQVLTEIGLTGAEAETNPGLIVKSFRERMIYEDQLTGKLKHWTQQDLGNLLGLTKVQICNMENHNEGLDSIDRRKVLTTILKIPPALLGLASLDDVVNLVVEQDTVTSSKIRAERIKIERDTIEQYQVRLKIYEAMYALGISYAKAHDIENLAKSIEINAKNAQADNKEKLLRILWDYELLCASVYGSDLRNWYKTFEHLDNALEIATYLNDKDLQAASFYIRSVHHLRQGRSGLAKHDIDGALVYARNALPQTKGAIYKQNARIHARDADTSGIYLAQKLFDEAEKFAGVPGELTTIKFGTGIYFINRAETLITIGRPVKALELLDDAGRYVSPQRYLVFLDILRARCYMEKKKPEYEEAVYRLMDAIETCKELRVAHNMAQIYKLYAELVASSYGNSPDVVGLEQKIQELKLIMKS